MDRGGSALVATVGGEPAAGDWFGFTHDTRGHRLVGARRLQRSGSCGTGGGGLLRYELKSDGQLFER